MAFKADEQFLRYLTMGAGGSASTAGHLITLGHEVIELERYTTANKVWQTKVKRLRLPDLMCLGCGLRVEARAKSKLEIKLSHSSRTGREWDAGLRDNDLVAFVHWDVAAAAPAERPEYFTVRALRTAYDTGVVRLGPPKAASEGAERDLTWLARVASADGLVIDVSEDGHVVRTQLAGGRRQSYRLPQGSPSFVYVAPGEPFAGHRQFLLGTVEPPIDLRCPGTTWDYLVDLEAADATARYAAIKAAGAIGDAAADSALRAIAESDVDERIRLEALGSLARLQPNPWTQAIVDFARAEDTDASLGMEAVFVLTEMRSGTASDALNTIAFDRARPPEQRAAAVWGLGVGGHRRNDLILPFIADDNDDVALHALAAVGHLNARECETLAAQLGGTDREAASAAALLARQGETGVTALLAAVAAGGTGATWAIAALGDVDPALVRSGRSLRAEVERTLEPLWARRRNWLRESEPDDALSLLERQRVRHLLA